MGPLLNLFSNPLPTPLLTRPLKNSFYHHFGVSELCQLDEPYRAIARFAATEQTRYLEHAQCPALQRRSLHQAGMEALRIFFCHLPCQWVPVDSSRKIPHKHDHEPFRRSHNRTLFCQNPQEATFEEPVKRYSWRDILTVSLVSLSLKQRKMHQKKARELAKIIKWMDGWSGPRTKNSTESKFKKGEKIAISNGKHYGELSETLAFTRTRGRTTVQKLYKNYGCSRK